MSDISRLKSQIEVLAQQAKATSGQLSAFRTKFAQTVGQVQNLIGGTSQSKDREVVEAIQDAQRKVTAASEALEQAARIAAAYGRSL